MISFVHTLTYLRHPERSDGLLYFFRGGTISMSTEIVTNTTTGTNNDAIQASFPPFRITSFDGGSYKKTGQMHEATA